MGWTVLYIAFGFVALWLLGEVLLQYKARLRWRLLAFTGFVGVVFGVLLSSVFVIALGAIAFAVGQTYVTLSFRRGFSTGWAIGGRPGASRRRKAPAQPAAQHEPVLEVSGLEYEPAFQAMDSTSASVYEPQPLPDDTGQYGVYNEAGYAQEQPYAGYEQPSGQETYATQEATAGQDVYGAQTPYPGQDDYGTQYDYGTGGQQQYAAYSDPYIGSAGGQQYGTYDEGFGGRQPYAEPYAGQQQYGGETPPGGVWVPPQRDVEEQGAPQPEHGHDNGYNEPPYR
jgi:hypothetical protein